MGKEGSGFSGCRVDLRVRESRALGQVCLELGSNTACMTSEHLTCIPVLPRPPGATGIPTDPSLCPTIQRGARSDPTLELQFPTVQGIKGVMVVVSGHAEGLRPPELVWYSGVTHW